MKQAEDEVAGVYLIAGRVSLVVADLVLAVDGEPIREIHFADGSRWTRENLEQAADRINARAARVLTAAS